MKNTNDMDADYKTMMEHLKASQLTFFKIFKLSKPLNVFVKAVAGVFVVALLWLWMVHPDSKPFEAILNSLANSLTIDNIMKTLIFIIVGVVLLAVFEAKTVRYIKHLIKFRDVFYRIVVGLGIGLFGWIGAQIHLRIFDRLFLAKGRIKKE